jgi:hypothetical protein
MDEARISNSVRSATWIATEYTNQSSPSTFMSFGSESQQGSTGQTIMASSTPSTATGRVKYRLSRSAQQAAGVYTNIVDYILTGTF